MPTTPIPAIGTISDPTKVRVALMQGNQAVNGPPLSVVADAVGVPSGGTTGQVLTKSSDADYDNEWADIPAQGDLSGPASAVDGNFAAFDGTTGKLVKDSGKKASDFATAAQGALADSATQPGDLATVATSGSYDDLTGAPSYQEGTFTPTIAGDTTAGTFTYSFQSGKYTKIGNICVIRIDIGISAVSVSPAGTIRITGLPFAAAIADNAVSMAFYSAGSGTVPANFGGLFGSVNTGTTIVLRYANTSTGGSTNLPASYIATNTRLLMSATYLTS